jgi:hypothetical protein
MTTEQENDLMRRLQEAFSKVLPQSPEEQYPAEALPKGTYVRPTRINRLGVITDAFYGELDEDNQKIIIYTILLLPQNQGGPLSYIQEHKDQYYLTNEYEYEVIAYLMMSPAPISNLMAELGGGILL